MEEKEKEIFIDLQRVPLKSEREERRKKRLRRFALFLSFLAVFAIGMLLGYILVRTIHPSYKADTSNTFGEIEYMMDNLWLYGNEHENLKEELEDKAFYGMTNFENDPYTSYMSYDELNEFSSSINMNYVGIGVEYSYFDNIALVKKVFKNSPAEKAGMLPGDIIETIDGEAVENLDTAKIKERVIGVEGTNVVLGINRAGQKMDVTITRGAINSTAYAYTENDYVVLEINSFGEDTAKECSKYLDDYTSYEKIVIDLRNNSGGYQNSVKDVCGLFIGGDKVYLRQKDVGGNETIAYTTGNQKYANFKQMVLLINENTASAAEVFALCLKEQHDNVITVGQTSYGKGVIQTNRFLNNGGAIKITTYYWYSPNGVSIHEVGIKPDVDVRMADIYYEYYSSLKEDESYEYDSVSEKVRMMQEALSFLNYDISRFDGYFDLDSFNALKQFKIDNSLGDDAILDKTTFDALISLVSKQLSLDPNKDLQMLKAKEIINGNNS